jgi:hypothetical protein
MPQPRVLLVALLVSIAGCSEAPPPAATADSAASAETASAVEAADATASAVTDATPEAAAGFPPIEQLLRADDTLASAQARLGADQVVTRILPGAEGEEYEAWVLYPQDPERQAVASLDEAGEHPVAIVVENDATDATSAWVRADGVRLGLSSTELETLNGGPFAFYGFGWDYGGTISDWRGGKLDPGADRVAPAALCAPVFPEGAEPDGYPTGDSEFSSDLPVLRAHPPRVCRFVVEVAGAPAG